MVGHTGFGRLSTVEAGDFHFVIQPLGRADIGDAGIDGDFSLCSPPSVMFHSLPVQMRGVTCSQFWPSWLRYQV